MNVSVLDFTVVLILFVCFIISCSVVSLYPWHSLYHVCFSLSVHLFCIHSADFDLSLEVISRSSMFHQRHSVKGRDHTMAGPV